MKTHTLTTERIKKNSCKSFIELYLELDKIIPSNGARTLDSFLKQLPWKRVGENIYEFEIKR